jgi:hypothetical protein
MNTAVGSKSQFYNTAGNSNTSVGYRTLYLNQGDHNTAVGREALDATDGSYNTALGSNAVGMYDSGDHNTGLGYNTLVNNNGGNNTAVGSNSLSIFAGNNLSAVGSGTSVSASGFTNASVFGYAAIVNASNKVRIGNSSVTVIEGQVGWSFPSDGRFKTEVKDDNVPGLAFVSKLRPVTYHFDSRRFDDHVMQNIPADQRPETDHAAYAAAMSTTQTGFIAQEVEQVCKELGYQFNGLHTPENETDNYSLSYDSFVPLLVKAIQEQQAIIEAQKKVIEEINTRLSAIENSK